MTYGTAIFQPNIFDRLGNAVRAFKAAPTPAQLYPPQQGIHTGYLTFPGWSYLEQHSSGNAQDETRVKKAVQSPSVFANMRAIATEFASSELIIKERKGTKLENVENHPLELLWEGPNPDMGRSFIMEFWAWSYTMTGKAYLYWLPANGTIKEVWPIPPFMMKPIPATKEFIGGYAFRSRPDAEPILIPRELITYSHSANIFDLRDSLAFLVAAMTPIESEIAMGFWNRNFFDEGNGIPDGMIALGRDTLDSDVTRMRQELRDFFGGTKRGIAVARETDMKYVAWGRSQKDAEFTEGIKLSSTQIGRTMGFPDGYWSESANRANAEQARATMIAGAVWPLAVRLSEDMNAQGGVVKRWWGEQYRAEFKDIRPEDRQLKIAEQESRKTHWTLNELREADGKDPLDDPRGDMLVAEIAKGTPTPATPAAEETEAYVAKQEAAVVEEEELLPEDEGTIPLDEETLPMEEGRTVPLEEAPMKSLKACPSCAELSPLDAIHCIGCGKRFSRSRDEDLRLWEGKAVKAVKHFKSASVPFISNTIPLEEQVRIREALERSKTAEDVRAAFKADDSDALLDAEWAAAMEWARKAGEDE